MPTARTFESDPNYMLLLWALESLLELSDAKPNYELIRIKAGLSSTAAVKKRIQRLLQAQTDAENAATPALGLPPVATPTTVSPVTPTPAPRPRKAGKDAAKKNDSVPVEAAFKKRKADEMLAGVIDDAGSAGDNDDESAEEEATD